MDSQKQFRFPERDPILSEGEYAVIRRMEEDPAYAAEVMRRAGIWDENNQLTEPYRPRDK